MEVVSLDSSFQTIEVRSKRISRMNKIVVVRDRFETKVEMWNPKYKSPQFPVSLASCPIERCLLCPPQSPHPEGYIVMQNADTPDQNITLLGEEWACKVFGIL